MNFRDISSMLLLFIVIEILHISMISLLKRNWRSLFNRNPPRSIFSVTPKPPGGWGDKNDDTLKNVKTLTRSESIQPVLQPDGTEVKLDSASADQPQQPCAETDGGQTSNQIQQMKNNDEKGTEKKS